MDSALNKQELQNGEIMLSGIAKVNGTGIWYEISGTGEVVVQIGGAVSAHEGYATVTPELSRHFTVLNYDHRGYGLSDRPRQRYTIQTWCDDLVALLDELKIDKAHIHGGSMGSFIAIAFAIKFPKRVGKLLLGAGAVAKCDGMGISHFRVWQYLAKSYGVGSVEVADELVNKAFSRQYIDTQGRETLIALMQDTAQRNADTDVFIDACQVMIDADVRADLGAILAPTLVMVGSEDVLTPLDSGPTGVGARKVVESIKRAELRIFKGSGHGHYAEQATESVEAILGFLKSS